MEFKIDCDDPKIIFELAIFIKEEAEKNDVKLIFQDIKFDIDIDTKKLKKNIEFLNQGKLELKDLDL